MRDDAVTSGPYLDGGSGGHFRAHPDGRAPAAPLGDQGVQRRGHELGRARSSPRRTWTAAGPSAFPAAAQGALAGLDPREAVAVEFLFAGSDGEERAHGLCRGGRFRRRPGLPGCRSALRGEGDHIVAPRRGPRRRQAARRRARRPASPAGARSPPCPRPGMLLIDMVPPCNSAKARTSDSPSPVPIAFWSAPPACSYGPAQAAPGRPARCRRRCRRRSAPELWPLGAGDHVHLAAARG